MSSLLEVEALIKWTMVPNIQKRRLFLQAAACTHNIAGDSIVVRREQKINAILILRVCADASSPSVEGHLNKGK